MRGLRHGGSQRPMIRIGLIGCAWLLAGCAMGVSEATTFAEVGEPIEAGIGLECEGGSPADCEQAVEAIVEFMPGADIVAVEIGPLDEGFSVTPVPAWAASAHVKLADGSVVELVVVQPEAPGPMEVNLPPD